MGRGRESAANVVARSHCRRANLRREQFGNDNVPSRAPLSHQIIRLSKQYLYSRPST